MVSINYSESSVKQWLKFVLQRENLKEFSVNLLEGAGKGTGLMGDVIFVNVTGSTEQGSSREYSLVLKCSKQGEAVQKNEVFQAVFTNELYVYDQVFPVFKEFQLKRNVAKPFNSVPKCYGTFNDKNLIVLENLKKAGYDLCNGKAPMTRNHIELVMEEYGKFHAISVAMKDQELEEFKKLGGELICTTKKSPDSKSSFVIVLENLVDEVYELVKDDVDANVASKWKNLKKQIEFICTDMMAAANCFSVIIHGDCWNNNFMFLHSNENKHSPTKVAILDWQLAELSSPVKDLSYFLFSCISKNDLEDLEIILKKYYTSFSNHLRKLGSDPNSLYPLHQLMSEWKLYSRYGVIMAFLPIKISLSDENDRPDITRNSEHGDSVNSPFQFSIRDKTSFKKRIGYIVDYAAKNDLI